MPPWSISRSECIRVPKDPSRPLGKRPNTMPTETSHHPLSFLCQQTSEGEDGISQHLSIHHRPSRFFFTYEASSSILPSTPQHRPQPNAVFCIFIHHISLCSASTARDITSIGGRDFVFPYLASTYDSQKPHILPLLPSTKRRRERETSLNHLEETRQSGGEGNADQSKRAGARTSTHAPDRV